MLGGGPAGAAAALRLARLGHRVVLVEREARDSEARTRAHVAEALPPTLRPLLASLGVLEAIDGAGFLRPAPPRVDWPGLPDAGDAAMAPAGGDGPGWLVDRTRLAALLRDAATRAGARALHAQAGAVETSEGRWQVALRSPSGDPSMLTGDFVLDARGRRGGAAQPPQAPRTVALLALWQPAAAAGADGPRMLVQAGRRAWTWLAPLAGGAVNVGVFVDADEVAGLDADARSRLYHAHLAEATLLAPQLSGRKPGPVRSTDATARCAPDAAPRPGMLLIGDAAVGLDPLSSQGVQAALRSAVQVAACVHTAWHRPQDAGAAWSFHRRQSADLASRHARWGTALHAGPAERWAEAFWQRRRPTDATTPQDAGSASTPRAWPGLQDRLALQRDVRLASAPVLEGDWVVERPVLQTSGGAAAAAFVAGVPVADWISPLQRRPPPRLADLLDEWQQRFGTERTQAAFSHLWQQRLLDRTVA